MSDRSLTFPKDRKAGQLVVVVLIDGVSRDEVEKTQSAWKPFLMKALEDRRLGGNPVGAVPEHSHWDWRRKQRAVEGLIAYRMFGVECEGTMQGLMLVSTAGHPCRIKDQRGKEQVYVDFVATAPWNSPGLVDVPRWTRGQSTARDRGAVEYGGRISRSLRLTRPSAGGDFLLEELWND